MAMIGRRIEIKIGHILMGDFVSSALGTKQYWDEIYERDSVTFEDNCEEIGEIWFGRRIEQKMVDYIAVNESDRNAAIIEVGSGNAHLLFSLTGRGFCNLSGFDYSEAAVELSRRIAKQRSLDNVTLFAADLFELPVSLKGNHSWVLDKGTFDAISLSENGKSASLQHAYIAAVSSLLNDKGKFLITSCNWTSTELREIFAKEMTCIAEVKHSTFQFGGQSGQAVCTLLFTSNALPK